MNFSPKFLRRNVLRTELENDFKFIQRFRIFLQSVIGHPQAVMGLMESRVPPQGLLELFNGQGILFFQKMGIAQIFHEDGIFGIAKESRPVRFDRLGIFPEIPIGYTELIEEKGAVVLLVSFVGFEEGNDFIVLAAAIELGRFLSQLIKTGEHRPLRRPNGACNASESNSAQEENNNEKKEKGEEPLSFPIIFYTHPNED